jgi:hypothetical protein
VRKPPQKREPLPTDPWPHPDRGALHKVPVTPQPLEISEYSLTVGDGLYRVRRAVERDTQGGFVTIHDSCGKPVLVFSAAFPDEHVHQLIVGWRAGHKQGLERGRRQGRSENVS